MRRSIVEEDFSKGIDTINDPTSIEPGFVSELENLIPAPGSVIPRNGDMLDRQLIIKDNVQGVAVYEKFGQKFYFHVADNQLYVSALDGLNPSPLANLVSFDWIRSISVGVLISYDGKIGVIEINGTEVFPSFTLRPVYTENISSITDSWWWVEKRAAGNDRAFGPPNREGSVNYRDSDITSNVFNKTGLLFYGYLVTLVRRTDDAAYSGGIPQTVTVYNPGVAESSAILENDIRYYCTYQEPISRDPLEGGTLYQRGVPNWDGTPIAEGDKVLSISEDQVYICVDANPPAGTLLSNEDYFTAISWVPTSYRRGPDAEIHLPQPDTAETFGGGIQAPTTPEYSDFLEKIRIDLDGDHYTHYRIYRTIARETIDEVKGSAFRYLADVAIDYDPASGPSVFEDNLTDDALSGTSYQYPFWGSAGPKNGKHISYEWGRLWVSDLPEEKGFVRFSQVQTEFNAQLKFLGHFRNDIDWVQVNPDRAVATAREGDDLWIFGEDTLHFIPKGDPALSPPILRSDKYGTLWPETISRVSNNMFFLSRMGPAVIKDGRALPLDPCRDGVLWPRFANPLTTRTVENSVFDGDYEVKAVNCNSMWIIEIRFSDTNVVRTCFVFDQPGYGQGCFRHVSENEYTAQGFLFQDIDNSARIALKLNDNGNNPTAIVMKPGQAYDSMSRFFVKLVTRRLWCNPQSKDMVGSAYDFKLNYTSEAGYPYELVTYSDDRQVAANDTWFVWNQDGTDPAPQRAVTRMSFPDGVYGTHFQFSIRREHNQRGSFDFYLHSLEFRFVPIRRKTFRFGFDSDNILLMPNLDGVSIENVDGNCNPIEVR